MRRPDDGLSRLSRRLDVSLLIVRVWKCCGYDVDSGGSTVNDGRDDSLQTASTIESMLADRGKRLFAAFSRLLRDEKEKIETEFIYFFCYLFELLETFLFIFT